jgi:hypothetical protein
MRTLVRVAIAILVSVLVASTAHAKRVAFVVGINKCDNLPRERQLAKAVNDARTMEAALKAWLRCDGCRHSIMIEPHELAETRPQSPASADGCSLRLQRGDKTTCMRCRAGFKMCKGLCVRMGDFGTPKRERLPRRNKPIEGIQ